MLSKRLRERIRLRPHESGRVRRGSLQEAAGGGPKPAGRQNPRHDIGHTVRRPDPGQPPGQGILKLQNRPQETQLAMRNQRRVTTVLVEWPEPPLARRYSPGLSIPCWA